MGNVVNLRTARKQKNRESVRKKKAGVAKSAGVTARERERVAKQNTLSQRAFDGHKREEDT